MNLNREIEDWLQQSIASFNAEGRPFVTLAYAQSWDGSITTRSGESLALSCKKSTQLTHQLRSLHDGILVGIGTVLSDDPQLTVREWTGNNPQPVILDSQLRTPITARLCHHPDRQCWILTINSQANSLQEHAEIISVPDPDGQSDVPLAAGMKRLREKGIKSLMVEGGAMVITAFLQAKMADALVLTIAPKLVGGYKAIGELLGSEEQETVAISPLHSAQSGDDLVVWGGLQYGEAGA